MKYITLLCFGFLSIVTMAQNYSLTIFNNSGQQFFVILNGIKQNSLPQTNIKIGHVEPGSYELKLIFADGKTGDINKKLWLEERGDYLLRVDFKKGKGKLKYFGVTNQGQPAGGTGVEFRPNDQSVYSDGQTTSSTGTNQGGNTQGTVSGNGASTGSVTTATGTLPNGNGQTSGNTGTVQGTATSTGNTGSGNGTYQVNTNTNVSDPNMGGTGNVGMTTTTTVTDPTMSGGAGNGMTTSTTFSDPSTGGTGGMSTTISDPTNGGNGGMTTTIKDPVTGETIVIDMNMNMSDPNLNGGTGNFGTTTTVNGMPNGTTTTSSSSSGSYHSTTTTTITENGSTTTTTTTEDKTWGDGQPKTTGTVTGTVKNDWGTQTTGTTTSAPKGSYSCTEVLVDTKSVQTKLKDISFDDDRVVYVQKDLAKYCMTTDQAVQILKTFTFEENKMDAAKSLYLRLTDKMNATKIVSLFTYEQDQEEFQQFIQSH